MYKEKHFKKSNTKHRVKKLLKASSLLIKLAYCVIKLIDYIINHL